MFTYFFCLVIIIFEAICCNLFYDVFCKENSRLRKSQKVLLMLSLICCYYLCGLFLSDMLILKMTLVVLAAVIIMSFYFEISIKKSVIFALLYQGLSIIVDYIAYISNNTIISKAGEVQKGYALEGSLVVIFSKITVFLCILLLKKHFGKKSTETLPDKIWGRFLFFPVFTIITIIAMIMTFQYTKNEVQANVLYSISLGLAVMNIFVYFLINDIVTSEAKLHEKEILGLQFKNQIDMYRSISENYEIQKKKSHEFKNHILCIESLLEAHEYDKASKYVGNISNIFIGEKNVINTNHVIINAILNTKYQEAISKNIVFVFKVNDLSKIVIKDEDLVVILANLLNNAIEACEKCEEKKTIKLKFVIEENLIVLSVKNTCSNLIIYSGNEIKTSKKDEPEMHGIGIKNIIQIVEKYNGEYVIKNEDNEFSFSIIIPL